MFNLIKGFTYLFGTGHSSSFLCGMSAFFTSVANVVGKIFNFVLSIMWEVIKFVMGILEGLEFMIKSFLGIKYDAEAGMNVAIDAEEIVQFGLDRGFAEDLAKVFKGLLIFGAIMLFVFTIFAIIKQEINNASSGFAPNSKTGKPHNQVGPVIVNMFKHMMLMLALPLIMLFLVQGVNSVLASFNNAFSEASGVTIAGQVLASSTYDANKYRTYANSNQRIPIIIEVYNPDDYESDEQDKLLKDIKKTNVQANLKNAAMTLAGNDFLTYDQTLVYENNKFYNSERYNQFYEKFICTAEQYHVMADFIDYAQLYNINYYVRSMDDPNIEWGFVSSTIYNKTDNSLSITYRDGSDFDGDGNKKDNYTLVLAPETEVTSPVSDALDSIMAMLGVGKYGDNVYKIMDRDDSGDFVNLVDWANEKCILKFSERFEFENTNTWTDVDQIIVYEFFHFPENNTLGAYSRADFAYDSDGVEVPVYQIAYKTYNAAIDGYSSEKYIDVINLNGNYYKVKQSETMTDLYGNPYYELVSLSANVAVCKDCNEKYSKDLAECPNCNSTDRFVGSALGSNKHFLAPNYSVLQETADTIKLQCSSDFDINNPSEWDLLEQVLVYEYFSDLSVNNVFGKYAFSDLKTSGVTFKVYNISDSQKIVNEDNVVTSDNGFKTTPYVLINGTFYELNKTVGSSTYKFGSTSTELNPTTDDKCFLIDSNTAIRTYYKYSVVASTLDRTNETYGFTDTLEDPKDFIMQDVNTSTFAALSGTDENFNKYSNFVLQFSENFKYTDTETWSYKDYFIFYLYANYKIANGIDAIRMIGIEGDIGVVELDDGTEKYCFKTKKKADLGSGEDHMYLDLENVINISELNVFKSLDYAATLKNNAFDSYSDNLFVTFEPTLDKIKIIEQTSTKFTFSAGFVPENVTTWTIGDYVLYYMSQTGKINSYQTIADIGYEALTYEVQDNAGNKDVLYGFGKIKDSINIDALAVDAGDTINKYSDVIYLSENRILALQNKNGSAAGFNSLMNWLNTNFYTYICSYYSMDLADVVTTKDSILSNIYSSYDDQILSFDALVNEIVNNNWTGSYDAVTTFTYKNSSYNKDDPSTWTNLDTLMFALSGQRLGALSSPIILGNDGTTKYIVYQGKAINISSGVFTMNVVDDLTFTKGADKQYGSLAQVEAYYNNTLKNLISTKTNLDSVNTITLKYSPEDTFQLTAATESTFTSGSKKLRDLDIILAMHSPDFSVRTTDVYDVTLYTDGVFNYLKVGSVYVLVDEATATDKYSSFTYTLKATMSLQNAASPFTKTSGNVYTPYTTLTGTEIVSIKPIDSAIYSVSNNLDAIAYQIYTFNSKNYLYIPNTSNSRTFIEYINTSTVNLETSLDAGDTSGTHPNEIAFVDYLYEKYYNVLAHNKVLDLSVDKNEATYVSTFSLGHPKSWNALDIILYQNGFISGDGSSKSFEGQFVYSGDKSKTYLKIEQTATTGGVKTLYINITNICDVSFESGAISNVIHKKDALIKLYMQIFAVRNNANEQFDSSGTILNTYKSINSNVTGKYIVGNDVKNDVDAACDITIPVTFNINNPKTWTWLDLLYYGYNKEIRTQIKYQVYYSETVGSSTVKGFIKFKNNTDDVFVEKTAVLTSTFEDGDVSKTVVYNPNEFDLLSIIVYSLTNQTSNTIRTFKFKLPSSPATYDEFYYIPKYTNGVYYGIYGSVLNNTDEFGFELILASGPPYTTTNENLNDNNYAKTSYQVTAFNEESFKDWTIADFIFAYAAGSISRDKDMELTSRLYYFASQYYCVVDSNYINLTTLASKGLINYSYSASNAYYKLKKTGADTLISAITYGTSRTNVLTTYSSLDNTEKGYITKYDKSNILVTDTSTLNDVKDNIQVFTFSKNFDPSNFSTWTSSDFVLYYMIAEGSFYVADGTDKNFTFSRPYSYVDEHGATHYEVEEKVYSSTNFQTFVANGGVPGYVYYLTRTDGFGNTDTRRIINFSNLFKSPVDAYIDYEVFSNLYNRMLAAINTIEATTKTVSLSLHTSSPAISGDLDFWHMTSAADKVIDLKYKNYYYFKGEMPKTIKEFNLSRNVTTAIQTAILSGTSLDYRTCGFIELKLSAGFDINNPNTWTLLDYIYMYEFSKSETNLNFGYDENDNLVINKYTASNIFYGLNYQDLANGGNYVDIYGNPDDDDNKYIALNGTVYNIRHYIKQLDETNVKFLEKFKESTQAYIDGNYAGEYITKLAGDLVSTDYGAGRFARKFIEEIQGYTVTGASEDEKVGNAIQKMISICTTFIAGASGSTSNDDLLLADYLYGRFLQYGNGTTPANKSLADSMNTVLENRITYLKNNAEYTLNGDIRINNCDYENEDFTVDTETGATVDVSTGTIVTKGTDKSSSFKVLYETINYSINRAVKITGTVGTEPDTVSYNTTITGKPSKYKDTNESLTLNGNVKVYQWIYQNTKEVYQVILDLYPIYEIYPLVMEVSWPQKLMNDMQVLYPDLNWATLIATDGWLDTLGEFTSAYTNGMYVSTGNSSNTTAAGLVLSEFFLSAAQSVNGSYAKYEYSSLFDEEILQSLMLAIMGEEEYTTLKLQAKVFMEFFNVSFAAILDDIAYEKAVVITNGKVDNFIMSVYKSFLATALLSSDIGEYLYTVATRVYAEYTIYESLAQAAGDYVGYYAYMNKQYDVNGNIVDAFTYGSFKELVRYENELCGNASPVFSFSMYKAYADYIARNAGSQNKIPSSLSSSHSVLARYNDSVSRYGFDTVYRELYKHVWKYYEENYSTSRILDTDPLYCFMFETYYEIQMVCGSNEKKHPIYLKEYKAYLEGTTIRWNIVKDVSITSTTQYLPKYDKYRNARNIAKALATINYVMLDGKTLVDDGTSEDQNAFQNFLDRLNVFDDEYSDTHYHVLMNSMTGYFDYYIDLVYPSHKGDYLTLYNLMQTSEGENGGDYSNAWGKILEIQKAIPILITEINEILKLETEDETTDNGSKLTEPEHVYEHILEKLNAFQGNIDSYISAQNTLDKISKTSINFALGEYGQNYIPTGYEFTVDGKDYTFSTDISAIRLAEYVMGGSYLEPYGIEAYYTDPDYKGIVQATKVYNSETGYVQTSLNIWKQLRSFAGQLANYTGKLYFMSNFADIGAGKKDGVKLDDYIFGDVYCSTFTTDGNVDSLKTTPEYLILKYLIMEENIDIDTFVSLIFGDTVSSLTSLTAVPASVSNLASYLNGTYTNDGGVFTDVQKTQAILDYLYYLHTSQYTAGYYNPVGHSGVSERIHAAFKNVMSYLLVSEEQEETVAENPIVLDDITMIEFKKLLMEKVVDYEKNPSETGAENSNRYIALFNLITCQFRYYEANSTGAIKATTATFDPYIGTQVKPAEIKGKSTDPATQDMPMFSNNSTYLFGKYHLHNSTRNLVLRLAGVENRPIEELVNLEYDNLYNRNGLYDEALGDVFVVCTMDEVSGKFIPVMARGKNVSLAAHENNSTLYGQYYQKYHIDVQSSGYDNDTAIETADRNTPAEMTAYPIIAKGAITADGYPTAIKMQDEDLYYYRTNIIALSDIDQEAVAATSSVSEVSTIGYTKYVESSAYKRVSNTKNKSTMFSSGYDLRTTIASNGDLHFAQEKIQYSTTPSDDYGAINVIDSFPYFYVLGGQTYLLILIGLSVMLPLLFNATASVVRRILDLLLLVVISPVMISMKQLDGDGSTPGMGTKAFDEWKRMLSNSLLYAFGYIMAFNIYYILVKTTLGMEFISEDTFAKITALGGLSFITKPLLEAILTAFWAVTAAQFVKGSAIIFTELVTDSDGQDPFTSAISGTEPMTKIKEAGKEGLQKVKQMANMAKSIKSGQFLNDLKNAAIQTAIQNVPGGKLAAAAIEAGHGIKDRVDAKGVEKAALDKGSDPATAKQAAKAHVEDSRKARQADREQKVESANRFMNTFMPSVAKAAGGNVFSTIPSMHALTEAEKAKYTPEYGAKQKKKSDQKFEKTYGFKKPFGKNNGKGKK